MGYFGLHFCDLQCLVGDPPLQGALRQGQGLVAPTDDLPLDVTLSAAQGIGSHLKVTMSTHQTYVPK